ncbi:hypothetical protein TNCV_4390471 [Trichonephila clavipes]|nr:hypothetical protein TNCV_4390471 [Trichonephila clavipes]
MAYAEKLAVRDDFDFQRHKGIKQRAHLVKSFRSHSCSDLSQTNSLNSYGHELMVRILLPLKTHRVDEDIPPADVVVRKERCQLRCPPCHSTEVQNYEVCDQLPSCCFVEQR